MREIRGMAVWGVALTLGALGAALMAGEGDPLADAPPPARYRLPDAPLLVLRLGPAAARNALAETVIGDAASTGLSVVMAAPKGRAAWEELPVWGAFPWTAWLEVLRSPDLLELRWLVLPGRDPANPPGVVILRGRGDPAEFQRILSPRGAVLGEESGLVSAILPPNGRKVWTRTITAEAADADDDDGDDDASAGEWLLYLAEDAERLEALLYGDTAIWSRRIRDASWRADLARFLGRSPRLPAGRAGEDGAAAAGLGFWLNTAWAARVAEFVAPESLPATLRDEAPAAPRALHGWFAAGTEGALRYGLEAVFARPLTAPEAPAGAVADNPARRDRLRRAAEAFSSTIAGGAENAGGAGDAAGRSSLRLVFAPGGFRTAPGTAWLEPALMNLAAWDGEENAHILALTLAEIRLLTGLHPNTPPLSNLTGEVATVFAATLDESADPNAASRPPGWLAVAAVDDMAAARAGWRRLLAWDEWRAKVANRPARWSATGGDTSLFGDGATDWRVLSAMAGEDGGEDSAPPLAVGWLDETGRENRGRGWALLSNRPAGLKAAARVLKEASYADSPAPRPRPSPGKDNGAADDDGDWTVWLRWDGGLTPTDRAAAARRLAHFTAPAAARDERGPARAMFREWLREAVRDYGERIFAGERGEVLVRGRSVLARGEGSGGFAILAGAAGMGISSLAAHARVDRVNRAAGRLRQLCWMAAQYRAAGLSRLNTLAAPDENGEGPGGQSEARATGDGTGTGMGAVTADDGGILPTAPGDYPAGARELALGRGEDGASLTSWLDATMSRPGDPLSPGQLVTEIAFGLSLDGYWYFPPERVEGRGVPPSSWWMMALPYPPRREQGDAPVTRARALDGARRAGRPILAVGSDGVVYARYLPADDDAVREEGLDRAELPAWPPPPPWKRWE